MAKRANSKCRQLSYVPVLGSNMRQERALDRHSQQLEGKKKQQLRTLTKRQCNLERESCRQRPRTLNKTDSAPTIPRRRPKHGEHRKQRELILSTLSLTEFCQSIGSFSSEISSNPSQSPSPLHSSSSPPFTIPIITVTNADLPSSDIRAHQDYKHQVQALTYSMSTLFSKDSMLLRKSRQLPHKSPKGISHRAPGRTYSGSTKSIVKLPSIDPTPFPRT